MRQTTAGNSDLPLSTRKLTRKKKKNSNKTICPNLFKTTSPEAMILFPFSEVSLGYRLQPPPLSLLGFPPFFFQLLVAPLRDLQQMASSAFGTALPPDLLWFVSGRRGLGHPQFRDAEPWPDAPPPQHHVHRQQAGSPQLQGVAVSHCAQTGAPVPS